MSKLIRKCQTASGGGITLNDVIVTPNSNTWDTVNKIKQMIPNEDLRNRMYRFYDDSYIGVDKEDLPYLNPNNISQQDLFNNMYDIWKDVGSPQIFPTKELMKKFPNNNRAYHPVLDPITGKKVEASFYSNKNNDMGFGANVIGIADGQEGAILGELGHAKVWNNPKYKKYRSTIETAGDYENDPEEKFVHGKLESVLDQKLLSKR